MFMSSRLPIVEHVRFISNVNRTGYVKGATTVKKVPSMLLRQLSAITIIRYTGTYILCYQIFRKYHYLHNIIVL